MRWEDSFWGTLGLCLKECELDLIAKRGHFTYFSGEHLSDSACDWERSWSVAGDAFSSTAFVKMGPRAPESAGGAS